MNAGQSYSYESQFGPPSELIHVGSFIQSALETNTSDSIDVFSVSPHRVRGEATFSDLSKERRSAIEAECSIDGLKTSLDDALKDPRLSAYARRSHDATIGTIFENAEANLSNRRKRKRADLGFPEDVPELTAFKTSLDNIHLQSWPLMQDAALFIRGPKNYDLNALLQVKRGKDGIPAPTHSAILTISVHSRIPWSHNFITRFSQHALLSSQSLGDLYETIPCSSNEFPQECTEDGRLTGYEANAETPPPSSGCVICIEGTAHGDGLNEVDYADKLIARLSGKVTLMNGSKIHNTPLSSLSLRLHEPYWLIHEGDCEHFIVFEQIRLLHPDDPPAGYPLALQITPPLLSVCRACMKVPAVYSIVGDMRLGESPSVLCAPCWRNMGEPNGPNPERVMVIPLPKHELGW
ncbi:hypothetical protein EW146_g204 [Bondarzewia mesenterica]|uniref:snRNA-activating protein complex subunit 3 n=1 Tax=Bondarzewia mesenterica TaxID=1095465 RepID=A0A4S4M7Q0_9AGAM|nr:hypothetical protein EW146_g204 [Bondarzewia mesenterica]